MRGDTAKVKLDPARRTRNGSGLSSLTFTRQYHEIAHTTHFTDPSSGLEVQFYLSHYPDWKMERQGIKLRMVDRSTIPATLSDRLLPGPKIQLELAHLLLGGAVLGLFSRQI